MDSAIAKRAAALAVLVAALGYFVDIYDLILFAMVRKPSLLGIGVCESLHATVSPADFQAACTAALTDKGIFLFDMQMGGMLVGGILWGVLGDKRGRLSVLFGSITLYSIANIANGMVHSVEMYALWRLVAGIGLAGELGAGVTLVSELMGRESRGVGTTLVAALGVSGGVVAGLIGGAFPGVPHPDWRVAYYVGGGLGLALLLLRIGVVESGMFKATAQHGVSRGNFFSLFTDRKRLLRYLAIIAVGVPVWFVIGIPFQFADVLGTALGLSPPPNPARAVFFCYAACTFGGLACGLLGQQLRSRKKTLGVFLIAVTITMALYFTIGGTSLNVFYTLCAVGGFATGYWAVFVSMSAELFGTNMRATVTTTVPNFVRGSAVLLTIGFKGFQPSLGWVGSAIAIGVFSLAIAFIGLFSLPETFAVDLDYHD